MSLIFKILYIFTRFVSTLILFRIILKIVNANITHSIVHWIIDTSDIFISPFVGILSEAICLDMYCIELTPIVSLIFFSIVGFVLSELGKVFSRTE